MPGGRSLYWHARDDCHIFLEFEIMILVVFLGLRKFVEMFGKCLKKQYYYVMVIFASEIAILFNFFWQGLALR